MRAFLSESDLDLLHPFAALSDESGTILWIGRSLTKLVPSLRVGESIWTGLELVQPNWHVDNKKLADLLGELIILEATNASGCQLRGHITRLSAFPGAFFFALNPALNRSQPALVRKLNISDFELGDPVFDFMLLARSLEVSNQRLAAANRELKLDAKLANTLSELAHILYLKESESALYRECVQKLCCSMGWDVGHVVLVSDDGSTLRSSDIWNSSEEQVLERFKEISNSLGKEALSEIPAETRREFKVSWVSEYSPKRNFQRSSALELSDGPCAVWIPVVVCERLVAIIELFSINQHVYSDTYVHFFALLGMQLARAIEHVRWHDAERVRIAQLAQSAKMATLGQISAGVAHEISNPISVVSLVASILKQSSKANNQSQELLETQADRLQRCVKRIETIVAELKVFSRDSSHDPMSVESLRKIIAETIDLCGASFSAKSISIQCDEIPEEWMVCCRAPQLMQVVLNLLSNAHDAVSEREERWIKVEVRQIANSYEIAVIDSGPGVPAAIRDKIMSPFFTTKAPGKGTGLGLSISANIMIDHGGRLVLDDSTGQTRFVVRIPKALSADASVNQ